MPAKNSTTVQKRLFTVGYTARLNDKPCEPPMTTPAERVLWEQGWKAANMDLVRKPVGRQK